MTKQEMKNEAIARMKMLKIYGNAIRDFRKKDRVLNKSEGYGALYWLNDEEKEAVKDFEERTGNMVYTCILNHYEFGECLTMLYVSKDPLDWKGERREVINREPWVYVYNKTFDYESEIGRPSEEIDTADTLSEARYLKREYEVGFGANWFIFIKKKRVRVNDDA